VGKSGSDIHSTLTIVEKDRQITATFGVDYSYYANSNFELEGEVDLTFAGYAIQAPEYRYNDFQDKDIVDKIVLAYYGEPLQNDSTIFFNGKHQTKYLMPDWKAKTVAEKGGKALVLIPTPENRKSYSRFLKRRSSQSSKKRFALAEENEVPVIYLSPDFSDKVFGNWIDQNFEVETKRLKSWLESGDKTQFGWIETYFEKQRWNFSLSYQKEEIRDCYNVIGVLPGKDSALKDEFILVGSHYDHEGITGEKLYYGADDNASGVSANLNVARAFSQLSEKDRPKRSIIFAFWDAEEKGTLGTKYFLSNPIIPLEKIKIVFNMDMIGRDASFNFTALRKPMVDEDADKKVMIFYSAQAPQLRDIAQTTNKNINLSLLYDPNVFFTSGSDHVVFHSQQIPVVYYFTGFHTDYTSPNDSPDKINYKKLTDITKHIASFVYYLAVSHEIPSFNPEILTAPEGDFRM
jgi:hypothetical protein